MTATPNPTIQLTAMSHELWFCFDRLPGSWLQLILRRSAMHIVHSILLLVATVSTAICGEPTAGQQLKSYFSDQAYPGGVFAQGKLDGVDYRKLLRGAVRKDPASLSGIFRYTANGHLMGEGAESNCDILRQLLRLWGDRPYSRVLAAEPGKVRTAVIDALDYTWPEGWKPKEYPLTFGLAKHDTRWRE